MKDIILNKWPSKDGYNLMVQNRNNFKVILSFINKKFNNFWSIIFYDYIGDKKYFKDCLNKEGIYNDSKYKGEYYSILILKNEKEKEKIIDKIMNLKIWGFHILFHDEFISSYDIYLNQITTNDVNVIEVFNQVNFIFTNFWDTLEMMVYGKKVNELINKMISDLPLKSIVFSSKNLTVSR